MSALIAKTYDLTLADADNAAALPTDEILDLTLDAPLPFADYLSEIDVSEATSAQLFKEICDTDTLILWALSRVMDSALGASLLFALPLENWAVTTDFELEGYAIDRENNLLILGQNGSTPAQIAATPLLTSDFLSQVIISLRDLSHESAPSYALSTLRPEEFLKAERLREADLCACLIGTAHELRKQGDQSFWSALIVSEYGDLAIAFEENFVKGGLKADHKSGMAAALSEWYKDASRVSACDRAALDRLEEALVRAEDVKAVFGSKRLGTDTAVQMTCLPEAPSYLALTAYEIANAPQFAQLPDAVNTEHLLQIMEEVAATHVGAIAFRDAKLAAKIFPI